MCNILLQLHIYYHYNSPIPNHALEYPRIYQEISEIIHIINYKNYYYIIINYLIKEMHQSRPYYNDLMKKQIYIVILRYTIVALIALITLIALTTLIALITLLALIALITLC